MLRTCAGLIAAAGLALAPLASDARMLVIPDCGAGRHMLFVPIEPGRGDNRDCAKPCHAVTDRRSKSPGQRKNCCV